jgi:DNA-binding response OmpR family regulator
MAVSASELYRQVWGKPSYGDVRTVTVQVHNLRQKIERDPKEPRFLKSVWGKGYVFDPKGRKG